jgi:sporulation protein YlmC with PRC-barrel domain
MTAAGAQVDLALRLLDDQLFDSDEHRCGRVDDIRLKGKPGSRTEVSALLVGPGAWASRLRHPFADAVDGLSPDHLHVIPWSEVTAVGSAVQLSSPATELGLETNEGRSVQWVGAPPRGTIRVSELLRSTLQTRSGQKLGRVWDVRVERRTKRAGERVNEPWQVIGLIAGRGGWIERIGLTPEGDPNKNERLIEWGALEDVADGVVTVSDGALG